VKWGYATLQLDSFGSRNASNVCTDTTQAEILIYYRAQDAYDAKNFLAELPFIDQTRLALIGWSHGGMAVLSVVAKQITPKNPEIPFKAAIAFYPWCDTYLYKLNAPLLILIGELDDWTPANICSAMIPQEKSDAEVVLKIYPGAYHDFDWEGMDEIYEGHRLLYDHKAASDAIVRVKQFLAKYLN
jgi:dienelactone hydrolase